MALELTRWDPFDDFRAMRRAFRRLSSWPSALREELELTGFEDVLPVDIYDEDDSLVVKAALPGVKSDDIDVSVTDGVLTINAETRREEEIKEEDYHRREFRYGKIHRSFRLPPGVDASKVDANYENGLLKVTIPRTPEAQTQKIEVKAQ